MSVCSSISLPLSLCMYQFIYLCLSVYLSLYLSLHIHMCICVFMCLCTYQSVTLCTFDCLYLFMCLSVHVGICAFVPVFVQWREREEFSKHSPIPASSYGNTLHMQILYMCVFLSVCIGLCPNHLCVYNYVYGCAMLTPELCSWNVAFTSLMMWKEVRNVNLVPPPPPKALNKKLGFTHNVAFNQPCYGCEIWLTVPDVVHVTFKYLMSLLQLIRAGELSFVCLWDSVENYRMAVIGLLHSGGRIHIDNVVDALWYSRRGQGSRELSAQTL